MGWSMFRERGGEDSAKLGRLVKGAKEMLEEICEIVEDMDGMEFGERGGNRSSNRGGNSGGRGGYGNRYGEREDWEEMEDYGERRRRDSRGRYM